MSYLRKFEYKITPLESYPILRNCSLCGCKSIFINSNHFRINANGSRIDVWLIYQCKKCKHTYNMTIHERIKVGTLPSSELESFMENNKELAKLYGTDISFFARNKGKIDWDNVQYEITNTNTINITSEKQILFHSGDLIQIDNPSGIKIRADKIISEVLHISRSKVKQLKETNAIEILKDHSCLTVNLIDIKK